ncbi:MAG: indole-3-glycerol phosphate synthase TrpC [Eubacteriales bacterium]|nr:indole-3-glycerol phosphate synthase TrpC [Eubacteriales bacterium]
MILQEIAENTRKRLVSVKEQKSLEEVRREAESLPADTGFLFRKALQEPGISFICEVKKASPSKGVIVRDFPYRAIAQEYEQAGASAISVLTEPDYFQGSPRYLREISETVHIPTLRKDFVVDAYQIFEAKILGAGAVLLISELLEEAQLQEYLQICKALGLSALTEAHAEKQVEKALKAGADILGVNNRNLETFQVDMQTSVRLRHLVPKEIVFVSESGIRTREDIVPLEEAGVDAVLIGETFMRSPNKKEMLDRLKGKCA